MLKLITAPLNGSIDAPRYIPVQIGMENVLVANGWSFLDPDESEPISVIWMLQTKRDNTSLNGVKMMQLWTNQQ